jgi:hypothetical protein
VVQDLSLTIVAAYRIGNKAATHIVKQSQEKITEAYAAFFTFFISWFQGKFVQLH